MAPKVSIVVPIYNLEKYVPRCLDALVNQTLEDIEIICVNDGSKDNGATKKVAESYGNVILVKEFDEFVKEVGYSLFICKGHDPNTKGRVENTVNIVKRGFLDGRTYYGIDRLNCDALNWLDTTGNSIVNDYTKRTPKELFPIENKALVKVRFQEKPLVQVLTMHAGFVEFRDNRYEMPQEIVSDGERIRVELQEDTLLFYVALTRA